MYLTEEGTWLHITLPSYDRVRKVQGSAVLHETPGRHREAEKEMCVRWRSVRH